MEFLVSKNMNSSPPIQINRGFLTIDNSDPRDLIFVWNSRKDEEPAPTPTLVNFGSTNMDLRNEGRRGMDSVANKKSNRILESHINRITSKRLVSFTPLSIFYIKKN